MTDDRDLTAKYMAAAGMLMEDLSAKLILDPLAPERVVELRRTGRDLLAIADIVDALRRAKG
jgi:hypothetical protein